MVGKESHLSSLRLWVTKAICTHDFVCRIFVGYRTFQVDRDWIGGMNCSRFMFLLFLYCRLLGVYVKFSTLECVQQLIKVFDSASVEQEHVTRFSSWVA